MIKNEFQLQYVKVILDLGFSPGRKRPGQTMNDEITVKLKNKGLNNYNRILHLSPVVHIKN